MPDLIAIGQGLTAIKTLSDLAKTAFSLRDSAKLIEAEIEFNRQILAVQAALAAAQNEQVVSAQTIRELEQQIADFKAWEAEKQRYDLKAVTRGAFAYMLKPNARGAEPPHWLCTNCFENQKRSILQEMPRLSSVRDLHMKCPACSNAFTSPTPPVWID